MPESLLAVNNTDNAFGGQEINTFGTSVSSFLFGPLARLAAIFGSGFGVIQALLTSNYQRLVIFLGIGASVVILPTFINSVFTILLP